MSESTPLVRGDRKVLEDNFPDHLKSCSGTEFIKSMKRVSLNNDQLRKIVWSDSLRNNLEEDEAALVAATFLLRDAIFLNTKSIFADFEEGFNPYVGLGSEWKTKAIKFCDNVLAWKNHLFLKVVFWIGAFGMIVLSFLEPPSWCLDNDFGNFEAQFKNNELSDGDTCQLMLQAKGPPAFGDLNEIVEYYPNWGITVLSIRQSMILMHFCLFLIIIHLLLAFGKNGFSLKNFFFFNASRGGNAIERLSSADSALAARHLAIGRVIRITQIFSIAMLCLESLKSYGNDWSRPFSPLWRGLIFASYSSGVQRELLKTVEMIPSLFGSLFALFLTIFVYGWIGVVAFYDSEEGRESFSSLVEAMWTLWICVTTANYPDVMMPAYNNSRIVVMYFVSFMIITFFFLMNIILGSVVQRYNEESQNITATMSSLIRKHTNDSFDLLDKDNTGTISRDTIFTVLVKLNELCPDIRFIPGDKMQLMFAILDKDGTNTISRDEYMDFSIVMLLEFNKHAGYTTFVENNLPSIYHSAMYQKFSNTVKSKKFDTVIDIILLLNAIVITIQSYPILSGTKVKVNPLTRDGSIDTRLEIIETFFTSIYCLELISKLIAFGSKRYFESGRNSFDATITVVVLLATLTVYYPNQFDNPEIIRVVLMVRVLRLLRLFTVMKNFQIIGETLIEAVPAAKRIITYMGLIFYLVTALGIAQFGGKITRNPIMPQALLLNGTTFADANYWANNFNDYPSGINTLFNLLIVNNWTEMVAGIEAVTESRMPRLFFLCFHILGVIVINNLVVALVIDTFMERYNTHENNGNGQNNIDSDKTIFDASEITGTKTDLAGKYVATVRGSVRSNQQHLTRLFTPSDRIIT